VVVVLVVVVLVVVRLPHAATVRAMPTIVIAMSLRI
jgi:hypothetical protein